MECRLKGLQGGTASRHHPDNVRDVVAVTVGIPDGILVGAQDLPGNIIAARRLLGADWHKASELTGHSRGPGILQFRARGPRPRVEEIVAATLHQSGSTKRLNHGGHGWRLSNRGCDVKAERIELCLIGG